jgi:hypothetical protein
MFNHLKFPMGLYKEEKLTIYFSKRMEMGKFDE